MISVPYLILIAVTSIAMLALACLELWDYVRTASERYWEESDE